MLEMPCPECGDVLRACGSQVSRLPGAEWQTHVDYQCADPLCAGRHRVTVPRETTLRGSAADVDSVTD
jgi:hypothetical protein